MRANPYAGRARKISPQILCGVCQPDLLFAGQVRGGLMQGWRAYAGRANPHCHPYIQGFLGTECSPG